MFFLVSPRSEKILSLGGFDPVYFLVNTIDALTLNLFRLRQRAHNRIDTFLLASHARIYQSLLDGMKDHWEKQNWIGGVRAADQPEEKGAGAEG